MSPLPAGSQVFPKLQVFPDVDALAWAAVERVLAVVASAPGERIGLCLSGGSTPQALYRLLAGPSAAGRLPWTRLHLFWGDDRLVPHDHPDSNVRMVREALTDHVPIPPENLHPIEIQGSPQACADAYGRVLHAWYGAAELRPERPLFDLVLMGLGEDGHTASLFPGDPAVDVLDRWTAGVALSPVPPILPRATLTLPALASCREMLFLVAGVGKRAPLARLAAGEDLPSGRARSIGRTSWFLDAAAAG